MNSSRAISLTIIIEIIILVIPVLVYGISLDALQTTTRFSGRFSLIIFSLIFLLKDDKRSLLLSEKSYLVFAIAHGIHLMELLSFVYFSEIKLIPIRLTGGVLAYLFIFVMPLISKRKNSGKILPSKFLVIENIYHFYIWFIFFMTYLPRVLGKTPNAGGSHEEHITLFGWVLLMLGIKLIRLIKSRTT